MQLPNVLVAPHLGGATRDVVRHQTEMIVDGVEAWLRGERPRYLANPAALDALRVAMPAIAVFDAGTGGAKCTVFDLQGALLGHHGEAVDVHRSRQPGRAARQGVLVRSGGLLGHSRPLHASGPGAGGRRSRRRHRRRHHQPARGLRVPRRRWSRALRRSESRQPRLHGRARDPRWARSASACTRSPGIRRRSSSRWRATSGTASRAARRWRAS